MAEDQKPQEDSPKEIAARMERGLQRAFTMKPEPRKKPIKKSRSNRVPKQKAR